MTELRRYEPDPDPIIATPDPTGGRLVAWADGLSAAHKIGTALCETSFVPKHFQGKPAEAAAAILFGDEIGFTPTQALRSIYVISGTPALYARAMVALVLSRGHELWTEIDTPVKVTVCGRRLGTQRVEKSEWTTERARRAGYTNNKKYETDPQAMLYARAASDVCRKIAADALAGLAYTVEEMELDGRTGRRTAAATSRTVQRAEVTPMPEPDLVVHGDEQPGPAPQDPPSVGRLHAPELEPITPAQLTKLHIGLNEAGITQRDDGLAYYKSITGRDVDSSKSLTKAEASQIIDALERNVAFNTAEPEPDLEDGAP